MVAVLVFLVGQLFLFGTTRAQCPVPCTPCKVFPDGEFNGTWNLKAEIDPRCIDSCLYQRDSDEEEMCFCDPGTTEYTTTCLGCDCKTGCDTTNKWLVVTGGDNTGGRLESTEIISSTGVCQPIPLLPVATSAGEMAFMNWNCKQGDLIFCGGSTTFADQIDPINKWGATNVCYKLPTGASTTWSGLTIMTEQRAWFSLTKIDQNIMIAVGGIDSSGVATDSMEQYSYNTDSWALLPPTIPQKLPKRFGHCTVLSKRGLKSYLIVIGGSTDVPAGASWTAVDTVYEVDVTDRDAPTIASLAPLPEPLFRPACTISCKGDIFVSGGAEGNGPSPPAGTKVYKYTVSAGTWSTVGSLNTGRWGHVMGMEGASANRKMSVAGGFDGTSFLKSVEDSFDDGVAWSDRIPGLSVEREYAAAAEVPANTYRC